MAYMRIHCENCGGTWEVYERDDYHSKNSATCPHCGKRIDYQTWEKQILPAFGMIADANRELFKDATGYHYPMFQFDVFTDNFYGNRKDF